jgi:hypothetical protein
MAIHAGNRKGSFRGSAIADWSSSTRLASDAWKSVGRDQVGVRRSASGRCNWTPPPGGSLPTRQNVGTSAQSRGSPVRPLTDFSSTPQCSLNTMSRSWAKSRWQPGHCLMWHRPSGRRIAATGVAALAIACPASVGRTGPARQQVTVPPAVSDGPSQCHAGMTRRGDRQKIYVANASGWGPFARRAPGGNVPTGCGLAGWPPGLR